MGGAIPRFPYKAWTGTNLPCSPIHPQMKFGYVEVLNLTHSSESASHNTAYSSSMPFQDFFHKTCSHYKYYRTEQRRSLRSKYSNAVPQ